MTIECNQCFTPIEIKHMATKYCIKCIKDRRRKTALLYRQYEWNWLHPECIEIDEFFLKRGKINTRGYSLEYK